MQDWPKKESVFSSNEDYHYWRRESDYQNLERTQKNMSAGCNPTIFVTRNQVHSSTRLRMITSTSDPDIYFWIKFKCTEGQLQYKNDEISFI